MGMRYQDAGSYLTHGEASKREQDASGMERMPRTATGLQSFTLGFSSAVLIFSVAMLVVVMLTGCAWNEHHARVSPRLDMDKHSATTY